MELPQRKSQRLQNYDYSQNGAYFITICTYNKLCLFGKNDNGKIVLNNAGMMIQDKFEDTAKIYDEITIDKFIVMPNHLHAIMVIQDSGTAQRPFPTKHIGTAQRPFPTI